MKQAVLISIQPRWCGLIFEGRKTLEIRKTAPAIECPYKGYIYQTKMLLPKYLTAGDISSKKVGGSVIGEFICDYFVDISVPYPAYHGQMDSKILDESCLTYAELHNYAGSRNVYGLHISELQKYDKQKPLNEFRLWNRPECAYGDLGFATPTSCDGCTHPPCHVQRAPQSWCYVEELP